MMKSKITTHQLNGKGGLQPSDEAGSNTTTWHHLTYTDKAARSWIKSREELSDLARMSLLNSETRPRAHINDDEVFVCLRGINFNTSAQPEDMISIRLWMNAGEVITSANQGSQSISNVLKELNAGTGPKTGPEVILGLIENLARLTDDFVEKIDERIDVAEDEVEHLSVTEFNPQMNQLRRQIANIRRYLLPQKEAIDKLYRNKSAMFPEHFYDQVYLYADKFIQLIENLDLLRERALMLQEHFMANISHQQNSRLYLLAIISAIFLPLTFVSGLFGMNVGGMPGIENQAAFWYVIVGSAILTIGLLIWFKMSRWF